MMIRLSCSEFADHALDGVWLTFCDNSRHFERGLREFEDLRVEGIL